jgi:hypothetical protein
MNFVNPKLLDNHESLKNVIEGNFEIVNKIEIFDVYKTS